MAINPQFINFGLQIAQGIAGFMMGTIQANLLAKLQQYQNEILAVQEAMNANNITINEINTRDASTRLDWVMQQQSASDLGVASVAAASAGVEGSNVDNVMRGLRRSEMNAQQLRKGQTTQDMAFFLAQRRGNKLAAVMAEDITVHQGPSILSAATGVAMNLLNTYASQDGKTDEELAGPSNVKPSTALGLNRATVGTLLEADPNQYWKFHTGPNG